MEKHMEKTRIIGMHECINMIESHRQITVDNMFSHKLTTTKNK